MTAVRLRELKEEDVEWVTDACQDTEIRRWTQVPRPYTRDHAVEFVSGSPKEHTRWVIEVAETAQPAGLISVHGIEDRTASIGYWIAPQYRAHGYTTSAILLVCDEMRELSTRSDTKVDVIVAAIARDNSASRRVVENAAFELIEERHGPAIENLVEVPTCIYARKL